MDIPYNKDGTTERVITSFKFAGAQPYGQGRGRSNENWNLCKTDPRTAKELD